MDIYIVYRELGHQSAFGEESLLDLTELQLKLLSITHTYDVIQSSLSMHDSYEEGSKTEIPSKVRPYPTKLLKWYNDWNAKIRKKGKSGGSKTDSKGRPTHTILQDTEDDDDAFLAYTKSRQAKSS